MPKWERASVVTAWIIVGTMLGYFVRMLLDFHLTFGDRTAPVLATLAVAYVAAVGLPALLAWWLTPEAKGRMFFIVLAGGVLGTEAVRFLMLWGPL